MELNRGTGLLVIEVRFSNPNGDPDAESEPRTLDMDGRGLISPVSFKRKVRDLVDDKTGPAWRAATDALRLETVSRGYDILERRGRNRDTISAMDAASFANTFWDARVFGRTFLEADAKAGKEHFISTGVVQFGPGISVTPIEVVRLTTTNPNVEKGKDRGMAPLGWRVVRHAVYAMPFFVNPACARKTDCATFDIDLLKFLIPHTYSATASAMRSQVEMRHAWYAEHKGPLGSCPDSRILDALAPRKRERPDEPSHDISEYELPDKLPEEVRSRLASFEDLCTKVWS